MKEKPQSLIRTDLASVESELPESRTVNKTKNLAVAYFWSAVFETNCGVSVVDGPVSEGRCKASTEASVTVDSRAVERHYC